MSGGSSQSPTPYQPTAQPQADQGFQSGVAALGSGASNLQSQVVPGYAGVTNDVANNPYYTTAMDYATQAANTASGTVAPSQFAGADSQNGLGDTITGVANTTAQPNMTALGLGLLGNANQAGNQVLQAGFDPQSSLYNQQYQQMLDQQNAINSMNGVAGSPYAAGVTGGAATNFNNQWENQQLGRESTAASAYDGLLGQGVSDYTGLVGGQASALASLGSAAGGAYTTGSNLNNAGLQTLTAAGQDQYQTYLQQQQAMLDALNAQTTGTNSAYSLTQTGVGDQGTYLGIGQTATSGAQAATAANNATSQAALNSIGNLAGTAAMFIPW